MTRCHWAILVRSKLDDEGRRGIGHHAKERLTPSGTELFFDEQEIPLASTGTLLVRI
jgi:hypothetical protein